MKQFKRAIKFLLIGYFIYLYIFGVLIYKVYNKSKSPYEYDISTFTEVGDEEIYAYLVEDREFALATRIALINEATTSIDVSYYTIHDGLARNIFFGALINAANRGVKIRVIVDGLSNIGLSNNKAFSALNANDNIKVKYYEPINPLLPHTINNTLHDKLIIIDKEYGLIGGRNIDDRMFIAYDDPQKETYDRDVLIICQDTEKSPVIDMKLYYDELFNHHYSKAKQIKKNKQTEKITSNFVSDYYQYCEKIDLQKVITQIDNEAIAVDNVTFLRSPLTRLNKYPVLFSTITQLFSEYDEVFIQSPYIIINNEMRKIIPSLDNKEITILTNNIDYNPNYFATSGYIRHRKKIAQKATLYEFQSQSSLHAKTFIFGDEISIIGSNNFDPRSTYLSTESMVVIYSKEFTSHLQTELDFYLEQSLIVSSDGSYQVNDDCKPINKRPFKRLIVRIISIVTYFHEELL